MNHLLELLARFNQYILDNIPKYYPESICKLDTNDKIIALTIDDSPGEHTDELLEILEKYDAHATFFVIGDYINKYDQYGHKLKKIIETGNEIGNHLMENFPAILLNYNTLEKSIIECENKITC